MRLRRNLNDWEFDDTGRLLDMLENYSLGDCEGGDEREWIVDT